jgi:hypothetical protein
MSSPPQRFPIRSVNENKALRQAPQAYVFAVVPGRQHSPTKAHVLVPKQSAANPPKSRLLPPLLPSDAEYVTEGENCEQPVISPEAKPRANLKEKMAGLAIDAKPKRHSVEPLSPTPCEGTESQNDEPATDDASMSMPAPILKLAKRNVRKPAPA